MFRDGFNLRNILALILGLAVVVYFAMAGSDGTKEPQQTEASGQPGN